MVFQGVQLNVPLVFEKERRNNGDLLFIVHHQKYLVRRLVSGVAQAMNLKRLKEYGAWSAREEQEGVVGAMIAPSTVTPLWYVLKESQFVCAGT